jgi:hypothetical protein
MSQKKFSDVKSHADWEYGSWTPDADDNTARRVVVSGGEVSGTLNPSGLKDGGRVTEVTINSTAWTALPVNALNNRNALAIQNRSGIEIKINYDNTVSGYEGMVIDNGGERFYDITDAIVIYAKAQSGTPTINIEELS